MTVQWSTIKNTATGTLRFEATDVIPIDLSLLLIGDYVNIYGDMFNVANRGSFTITNVEIYYVGPTLYQAFEVKNPAGVEEVVDQLANSDLMFFRPTANTIQNSNNRTVVVSSTTDGVVDISMPATTEGVSRTASTASYLHNNSSVAVSRIDRSKTGEVTVYYSGTPYPDFSISDNVYIDDVVATPFEPFKSLSTIPAWPANATTSACRIDSISALQQQTTDTGRFNFALVKALNGDALIMGGIKRIVNVPSDSPVVSRFRSVSSAIVSEGNLSDGATRYTYQWPAVGVASNGFEKSRAASIINGSLIGSVLVVGGATAVLGNWSVPTYPFTNSYVYDPVANTSSTTYGASGQPTAGHSLTPLTDGSGRIVFYGGLDTGGSNNPTNQNRKAIMFWDPLKLAWYGTIYNTKYNRAEHSAVVMSDGTVLFTGGLKGANGHQKDSKTLALWTLNEGTFVFNDFAGGYNLSTTGTVSGVPAKILGGAEFTQGGYASGLGNITAVNALLSDWTVEWWSSGATGTYPGSMVLSGLGTGTILAYGGTTEAAVDNTLLHIRISGGNVIWRWENAAGFDITGTIPIPSYLDGAYNHFGLRKRFNSSTASYDVDLFVNGILVGSSLNRPNSTGGSNATNRWYIAKDPDGVTANGFTGVLNDVRVSSVARSDTEILIDFWEGCASLVTTATADTSRIGRLLNYCETWSPTTTLVQDVGSMSLCRAYHTSTLLSNGKVLVTGGLAHSPTDFVTSLLTDYPNNTYTGSAATNTTEIYDPSTKKWSAGPTLSEKRYGHTAIYVQSRNCVFIIGGSLDQYDGSHSVEIIDLNTMTSRVFIEQLPYYCGGAVLLDNGNILCVTNMNIGGTYQKDHFLICLESPGVGTRGIGDHNKITAVGSGYFKYQTPVNRIFSNFGKPNNSNVSGYTISSATRTSSVTTINFGGTSPFLLGETVFVNINNPALFTPGVKTITAITSNTISYDEIGPNLGSTAITGQVFRNYSKTAQVTSWKALSDTIPGPYLFNPIDGIIISSLQSSIGGPLFTSISKDHKYAILPVLDANVFPDSEGYVVIGFGSAIQTTPIKYYGRYDQDAIMIDYNYSFQNDIPLGTDVTLLTQREPFSSTEPIGGFYLTSSAAGRLAAENTIRDIAAAGIEVNVTIQYPGDNGLGGQGFPARASSKLSDKVVVFGSDDLDAEINTLKGG